MSTEKRLFRFSIPSSTYPFLNIKGENCSVDSVLGEIVQLLELPIIYVVLKEKF